MEKFYYNPSSCMGYDPEKKDYVPFVTEQEYHESMKEEDEDE